MRKSVKRKRRKRKASHTWNAILYGREALKKGLIKRVGDGSTIRAWEDPWIPSNHSRKPLVRLPDFEITMVSELIDQNLAGWDKEKLEDNFIPMDVAAISAIPLGRFYDDDWAWSHEKSGNFTVRSICKLLEAEQRFTDNPSSSGASLSSFWKKLWKIPVPLKVRAFWWRVINGFVPCRQILSYGIWNK